MLLGVAAPLAAQAPPGRLAARADSLAALWREASAMADLTDRVAHAPAPPLLDTIVAGALRVIINPSPLPVRSAAGRAWRTLDSLFGVAAARVGASPVRLIAVEPDSVPRTTPSDYSGHQIEVRWDTPEEELRQLLLSYAPVPQPDSQFGAWLSTPVRALIRDREERESAYLQLVTAPWSVVRRCYRGDLASCTAALGLDATADPALTWYLTPEERQTAVEGMRFLFSDGRGELDLRRCRGGQDSVCSALLHEVPRHNLPRPLDGEVRYSLFRSALSVGGRESYERLLHHSARARGSARPHSVSASSS